jgi:hypothetical protein
VLELVELSLLEFVGSLSFSFSLSLSLFFLLCSFLYTLCPLLFFWLFTRALVISRSYKRTSSRSLSVCILVQWSGSQDHDPVACRIVSRSLSVECTHFQPTSSLSCYVWFVHYWWCFKAQIALLSLELFCGVSRNNNVHVHVHSLTVSF